MNPRNATAGTKAAPTVPSEGEMLQRFEDLAHFFAAAIKLLNLAIDAKQDGCINYMAICLEQEATVLLDTVGEAYQSIRARHGLDPAPTTGKAVRK